MSEGDVHAARIEAHPTLAFLERVEAAAQTMYEDVAGEDSDAWDKVKAAGRPAYATWMRRATKGLLAAERVVVPPSRPSDAIVNVLRTLLNGMSKDELEWALPLVRNGLGADAAAVLGEETSAVGLGEELAAARSEIAWRDEWSNSIANRMPAHYDGEDAQEAIIDRWLDDVLAEREQLVAALRDLVEGCGITLPYDQSRIGPPLQAARAALVAFDTQETTNPPPAG